MESLIYKILHLMEHFQSLIFWHMMEHFINEINEENIKLVVF
ncbi:Uncharacterised protein [Mycobacteroides abscessus subsp. abscessus]|nr:Uncharacterised protein [Mycobacteroides abscessus subsp. abscessus]